MSGSGATSNGPGPSYPSWPGRYQVDGGDLPRLYDIGPPDLHPSGHNPAKRGAVASRGRQLAGNEGQFDIDAETASADGPGVNYQNSLVGQLRNAVNENEMKDYPAVLDELQRLDDTQGNGIFDAHGTHGNIHPDAGVFADREALPGYVARERFFKESEVVDVNSGRPVVYVPGNAFMLDPRTEDVLEQRNLYEPGLPSTGGQGTPFQSTWIPKGSAWPVGAIEENGARATGAHLFIAAGLVGLAVGAVYGLMRPKKG